MDIYTALRGRRSVNSLSDAAPARAVIQRIIDAAVWAPNHHMTEPWRFQVLAGRSRAQLGEAVATWLRRERDLTDPATQAEIKGARSRLTRAPVVVVVGQVVADDALTALEDYAACCCATQNLLLAAHAEGLAAKWRTGPMAEAPAAKQFLGLREADRIVAYVYLGYPAANLSEDSRTRRPARVDWVGWDE